MKRKNKADYEQVYRELVERVEGKIGVQIHEEKNELVFSNKHWSSLDLQKLIDKIYFGVEGWTDESGRYYSLEGAYGEDERQVHIIVYGKDNTIIAKGETLDFRFAIPLHRNNSNNKERNE